MTAEKNQFFTYSAGVVYSDENITVRAFPNAHMANKKRPSYSLLIEGDGKRVLFSGDLSQALSKGDFPSYPIENSVDALVLEFAHFTVDDMLPYLEKCNTGRLVFNHLSRFEEKKPLILELSESGKLPYHLSYASDGEVVEV